MKKLILLGALGIAAATYQPAQAQVNVSINIGSQPQWGPRGYDYVNYYYLPEIQSYYHVPTRKFIYLERNKWVQRRTLPSRYRSYNLYQGQKIVINRPKPYLQHQSYQNDYRRPADRQYKSRERAHRQNSKYEHGRSRNNSRH